MSPGQCRIGLWGAALCQHPIIPGGLTCSPDVSAGHRGPTETSPHIGLLVKPQERAVYNLLKGDVIIK